MNSKRPVNLDLGKFHFPLPAITSILHRISGIIIFVGVAFLLYGLQLSLSGEEGFSRVNELLNSFLAKLIIWGILSALLYHLVAGIKHLLMDMGIGEELESGRIAAKLTIVILITRNFMSEPKGSKGLDIGGSWRTLSVVLLETIGLISLWLHPGMP